MYSVKSRIESITQPRNGYISKDYLRLYAFDDGRDVNTSFPEYSSYASIQGTVVDYLTRFMCGADDAFNISLIGAQYVDQLETAQQLVRCIKGLDQESVLCACKLAGYDVAYRRGPDFFSSIDYINPPESVISNIIQMVERSLSFLRSKGALIRTGFTFEGGYSKLISSGDGDYLTEDGLWDFKVSTREPTSKETLQILVYYILGLHSVHKTFKKIKRIGLFNPLKNQSYEILLSELPDDVFHAVSRRVIGYKIPDDIHRWREVSGDDESIINEAADHILSAIIHTGFNPSKYEDGIYDITVNDYWSFFRDKSDRPFGDMPKFNRTDQIKFLKHDGFVMFISVSPSGSNCVLHGGFLRRLDKPISYYYDNLPAYGRAVLQAFSQYWDAIYSISDYIKELNGEGRVHGCIVDIDYFNHLFLRPDGLIIPYFATTMYAWHKYKSLPALLSDRLPHMLPRMESITPPFLLDDSRFPKQLTSVSDLSLQQELVYGTEDYVFSNWLKIHQLVFDYHLVAVWDNRFLPVARKIPCTSDVELFVWEHMSEYLGIVSPDTKKEKNESLVFEVLKRITEAELFAIIKILVEKTVPLWKGIESLSFSVSHFTKPHSFRYTTVQCKLDEIPAVAPLLIKPRKYYQMEIRIQMIPSKKPPEFLLDFFGGKNCILSAEGAYRYEQGRLVPDRVSKN